MEGKPFNAGRSAGSPLSCWQLREIARWVSLRLVLQLERVPCLPELKRSQIAQRVDASLVPRHRPISPIIVPVGAATAMMPVVMVPVMIVRGLRISANGHNY
jgi:hypothetical protein